MTLTRVELTQVKPQHYIQCYFYTLDHLHVMLKWAAELTLLMLPCGETCHLKEYKSCVMSKYWHRAINLIVEWEFIALYKWREK